MQKGEGLRYNDGKLRYDLIHPKALEGLVKVLTKGSHKYKARNWEAGMNWTTVIASAKRHLAAIEAGEDVDAETGEYHVDHLQCNAHFLSAYYQIYPEGDDRQKPYFTKKVALDLDGCLIDFSTAFCKRAGISKRNNNWSFTYEWKKTRDALAKDKDFWMSMEPLVKSEELLFEPSCYITNRMIPTEWSEEWLENHGFNCVPVYQADESKVEVLKNMKIDLFVDDSYANFVDINNNGGFCYLITRPYNEKWSVGHRRIHHLNEIVKR